MYVTLFINPNGYNQVSEFGSWWLIMAGLQRIRLSLEASNIFWLVFSFSNMPYPSPCMSHKAISELPYDISYNLEITLDTDNKWQQLLAEASKNSRYSLR